MTTDRAQRIVKNTLSTLDQNCADLFNSKVLEIGSRPHQTILNAIENATATTFFYEADGPEGNLTLREATGLASAGRTTVHDWAMSFYTIGDDARTMNYRQSGSAPLEYIPHVVLYSSYFNLSEERQGLVLLHEPLHVVIGTHE